MNKKTRLLMGICVTALAASLSSAVVFANAESAEQEQTTPVLTMQNGASIRYIDPVGIRFVTDVTTEKYNEITKADSKAVFGTLIIPKEVLGDTVITADNYLSIGAENIVADKWLADTETTKSFACALGGTVNEDGSYNDFPAEYYNAELYAVSYCSYKATENATKNTVIFAENPQCYSVAYIASALQARGDEDKILSDITDSVLGETMAFESETYVMCKGDTLQTVLNAKGLKATYSTNNEAVATVDENGVVTGVGAGTAQITAKIGNKTATVNVTVTDIFEKSLDDLQLPLYEGSTALPKEYDGFYDSNSLAVKQNGVAVASDKYSYNSATQTITFNEAGVYELTYTLTCGEKVKDVTCTATVGVVNGIDSIATECTPWFAPGANADWNQNMVTIAEAGITKPESAVDVGDNLLKCTVRNQQYVAPVFALGDFLEHLSELNDSDYLRIWVYYTGTWSGGNIFHEWNFWGTGNPSRLENNLSLLPQNLGSAKTWVGLDFTVAEIKAQLEKQNQTYQNFDWFKSNAYLYTMITLSKPCDIYFYSVEFHKEAARGIDASSAQGVIVQENAIPLNTVEVDARGLEYGKVVEVVNAETSQVIATINGKGSFVMPYANVTLRVTDIFGEPLDNLQLPLYEGSAALPEEYKGLYESYTLTVKQNGAEVLGEKYTFDMATETITFNEAGVYELTYTLTYGDNSKKLTCTATVGVLTEYSNANVPNYVDYCTNQLWGKGDVAAAKQLNDVSLNKPSSAIDVDSNTVLQYTTTGNQVAHALKVSYLTDILTNGSDNDYISIWLYRTGAAVSDQNFWMIGNAEAPYVWEGKMYVNYNADSTDGQKIWVNGENKSATYSEEYAQYVGNEWFELKFTVKELKDQLNKQGADLETMKPQWILLSFGLSSATDSVSYYSIEYHKA